jgi:hypothetical protein
MSISAYITRDGIKKVVGLVYAAAHPSARRRMRRPGRF